MANRSFYFGNQLTADELSDIQDRGQFPYSINKVRKAIRGISGMLAASLPKFKLVAVGETDNEKVALCNDLIDWVWRNSDDIQGFSRIVKRAAIDNISYFHVIKDRRGMIKYVPLTFEDVVVDPASKDSLFRDAYRISIKKYIPVELAKALYGIQSMVYDAPVSWMDMQSDGSSQSFLGKMFSADKLYVLVYETYRKQYVAREDGFADIRIIKDTLVGFNDMFTETLPKSITEYPIIPVYVEDTENPYKLGEVHFMKGIQKFINKAYGVALYNAQLLSNPKVLIRETDVPNMDIKAFEDNFSTPGAIGVLAGNAGDPIIVQGQPLNSAFFMMYQDAVMQFEQATIPGDVVGYQKGFGERSSSHLLDIKESVLDSFKDFAGNIEKAVSQLGKVALQYVQAYVNQERIIKILDSDQRYKEIAVNKKQGLNMEDPQSIDRYVNMLTQKQVPEQEIERLLSAAAENKEVADNISYLINNVEDLNFDVYVIPGSYSPTYKMAMLRLMMELYEMQAVDNTAVLELAPVGNRDDLIERFSENRRLFAENENLTAKVEAIESTLAGREKELADMGIFNVVEEVRFKQEKILADTKLKAYLNKQRNKLVSKEMIDKIHDDIRDIIFKAKLSTAKAELTKDNPRPDAKEVVNQIFREYE